MAKVSLVQRDLKRRKLWNKYKEKRANLCIKPPAINSSPNGPASLRDSATNPKISLPLKNWKKISNETNKTDKVEHTKNNLKLIIFFSVKYFKTK